MLFVSSTSNAELEQYAQHHEQEMWLRRQATHCSLTMQVVEYIYSVFLQIHSNRIGEHPIRVVRATLIQRFFS